VRAGRRTLIDEGMARGGSRAATELFLRSVAGDEVYDRLETSLRDRLLDNGDVLFAIDMAVYLGSEPTLGQLASIRLEVRSRPVAGRSSSNPACGTPGAHMACLDQPRSSPLHFIHCWLGSPDLNRGPRSPSSRRAGTMPDNRR
jgi:hypothetical protein